MSDQEGELYDEFGNYIGPDLEDSSSDEDSDDEQQKQEAPDDASDVSDHDGGAIVIQYRYSGIRTSCTDGCHCLARR